MRSASLGAGALLVVTALVLAACTSGSTDGGGSTPPPDVTSTVTSTRTVTPPIDSATPVVTGPTTSATASSCPLLAQQTAAGQVGMRLDRITVSKSGGKVVGCRFYALQHPNAQCDATCLAGEHLPPGTQPVVDITTVRYASEGAAHNAFVLVADKGTNPQQASVGVDNTGVCYQIPFYPKDKGRDWACAFSVDKTMVVVKTVALLSFNVIAVAREIARKV